MEEARQARDAKFPAPSLAAAVEMRAAGRREEEEEEGRGKGGIEKQ
jgi:hypothetical protein